MNKEDRKQQIIDVIVREIPFVDIRRHSHNIISLKLRALAEEFGIEESNKVIRTTKLKDIGWEEEYV